VCMFILTRFQAQLTGDSGGERKKKSLLMFVGVFCTKYSEIMDIYFHCNLPLKDQNHLAKFNQNW